MEVGDEVMLTTGWTRMICLFIHPHSGFMIAKYDHPNNPVTRTDFNYPNQASSCQKRHCSRFKPWDGARKKANTMRYKSTTFDPQLFGKLQGRTNDGAMIIELDRGEIVIDDSGEFVKDVPLLFSVRATNGSKYRCFYEMPRDVHISIGDFLVSDSGNFYKVMSVGDEHGHHNVKGVFKGQRVLTAPL